MKGQSWMIIKKLNLVGNKKPFLDVSSWNACSENDTRLQVDCFTKHMQPANINLWFKMWIILGSGYHLCQFFLIQNKSTKNSVKYALNLPTIVIFEPELWCCRKHPLSMIYMIICCIRISLAHALGIPRRASKQYNKFSHCSC